MPLIEEIDIRDISGAFGSQAGIDKNLATTNSRGLTIPAFRRAHVRVPLDLPFGIFRMASEHSTRRNDKLILVRAVLIYPQAVCL